MERRLVDGGSSQAYKLTMVIVEMHSLVDGATIH